MYNQTTANQQPLDGSNVLQTRYSESTINVPAQSEINIKQKQKGISFADDFRPPPRSKLHKKDSKFCYGYLTLICFTTILSLLLGFAGNGPNQLGVWNRGVDPDGNICGYGPKAQDYPFVYQNNPHNQYLNDRVCVKDCSSADQCLTNVLVTSCQPNASIFDPSKTYVVYESFGYQNSVCIPSALAYFNEMIEAFQPNSFNQFFNDIWRSKLSLIINFPILMLIVLAVQLILERHPLVISWTSVLINLAFVAVGGIYFIQEGYNQILSRQNQIAVSTYTIDSSYINEMANPKNPAVYILLGFALATFFTFFLRYVYYHSRELTLMANGVQVSQRILSRNPKIIKYQIFITLIIYIVMLTLFIIFCILASSGMPSNPQDYYALQAFAPSGVYLFSCFLMAPFFVTIYWSFDHFAKAIIAFQTTIWYFQQMNERKAKPLKYHPDEEGLRRVRIYHLGSVMQASIMLSIKRPYYVLRKMYSKEQVLQRKLLFSSYYCELALTNSSYKQAVETSKGMVKNNFDEQYHDAEAFANILSFLMNNFISVLAAYSGSTIYSLLKMNEVTYSTFPCLLMNGILGYVCSSIFMNSQSETLNSLLYLMMKDKVLNKNRKQFGRIPNFLHEYITLLIEQNNIRKEREKREKEEKEERLRTRQRR